MKIRLLLDANVPPSVADALRQFGIDAVPASGNPALETMPDRDLLEEAVRLGRALVTFNIRDFWTLAIEWAHTNHRHMGIILVPSRAFPHADVGGVARALAALLTSHDDLSDVVLFLRRTPC